MSLSELESECSHCESLAAGTDAASLESRRQAPSSDVAEDGDDKGTELVQESQESRDTSEKEAAATEESNVFRIQEENGPSISGLSTSPLTEASCEKEESSVTQQSDEKETEQPSENVPSKELVNMLNDLCCIFPAAVSSPDASSQPLPLLTLRPEFVEEKTPAQIFSWIESATAAEALPFLGTEDSHVYESWVELVKRRFGSEKGTSVPIHALVLARLEAAIYLSFNSNSNATQPEVDIELAGMFKDIQERALHVTDALQKLPGETASAILEPLGELFGEKTEDKAENGLSVAHLFLTPLLTIAKSMRDSGGNGVAFLEAWNSSLVKSIHLIDQVVKSTASNSPQVAALADIDPPAEVVATVEDNADLAATTPSPSRKRRKKKKKGKRKNHAPSKQTPPKACVENEKDSLEHTGSPTVEDAELAAEAPDDTPTEAVVVENNEIEPTHPPQLAMSVPSFDSDDSSSSSESAAEDRLPHAFDEHESGDLRLTRLDGVRSTFVVVTPGQAQSDSNTYGVTTKSGGPDAAIPADHNNHGDENGDDWETVEVKNKSRKKVGERQSRYSSNRKSAGSSQQGGPGGKKPKVPRNRESRKRTESRKMVREILHSILDSVHSEVARKQLQSRRVANEPFRHPSNAKNSAWRDAAMGTSRRKDDSNVQTEGTYSSRVIADGGGLGSERDKNSPSKSSLQGLTADQNTAPTAPDTLSTAVSTYSLIPEGARSSKPQATRPETRRAEMGQSESMSSDSTEDKQAQPPTPYAQAGNEASLSPPLPTLLSAGNENSASSSVASSLDAPHSNRHHHSSGSVNENDVGYHLLDVCDRLTRDMALFMNRRSNALTVRRMERVAVLQALQDTLQALWPGFPTVEPYGSCATLLDLPSSDLDVVVRGLDVSPEFSSSSGEGSAVSQSGVESGPTPVTMTPTKSSGAPQTGHVSPAQFSPVYGGLSVSGERVVRLAEELQRQPWAVHVKAIPAASVPVVKILADPARLLGSTVETEWLGPQGVLASSQATVPDAPGGQASIQHTLSYVPGQNPPVWRGADVVNGLLQVDITFEGPEHGGIGSTQFSSQVVQHFCEETGLPPESTPAVQALMVLKELLAQRRLNEPFQGGLSSYALLLLVVSLIREREIIKEELERAERQRRKVAYDSPEPVAIASGKRDKSESGKTVETVSSVNKNVGKDPGMTQEKPSMAMNYAQRLMRGDKSANGGGGGKKSSSKPKEKRASIPQAPQPPAAKPPTPSSWASIAKKSSASTATKRVEDVPKAKEEFADAGTSEPSKPAFSFADAVAKGNKRVDTQRPEEPITAKASEPPAPGADSGTHADDQKRKAKQDKAMDKAESPEQANENNAASDFVAQQECKVFPRCYSDVIEVLCSGETTAGKLLMHFLLFYGQHFDSFSTAIDYSGTHERDYSGQSPFSPLSPYIQRKNGGSYDPMTGMLTVDPIVVYDPLEGAETRNVARSCYQWSSIRWTFHQSYQTLSSVVEMNTSPSDITSPTKGKVSKGSSSNDTQSSKQNGWYGKEEISNPLGDPSSILLEYLLSF